MQVASAKEGVDGTEAPYVLVWDTRDLLGVITRIDFPEGKGESSRYVLLQASRGGYRRMREGDDHLWVRVGGA